MTSVLTLLHREVTDHFVEIFGDTEWFVRETMKELEAAMGTNREDTARLRQQLAESTKLTTGLTGLLADSGLTDLAKDMIREQINGEAVKRHEIKVNLDQLGEKTAMSAERMIAEVRRALDEGRERLGAVASPEDTHAFMSRFVGPSVSLPDGRLLPPGAEGTGKAGAHSNIAATGLEPVTRGL